MAEDRAGRGDHPSRRPEESVGHLDRMPAWPRPEQAVLDSVSSGLRGPRRARLRGGVPLWSDVARTARIVLKPLLESPS